MADLTAKFSLVDLISDKLSSIADAGQRMLDQWSQTEDAASSAMDGIASSSSGAVSSVDGVARSLEDMNRAADSARSPADGLADALADVEQAAQDAAGAGDSMDAVAESVEQLGSAAADAAQTADELSSAADGYGSAAAQAAADTDIWTDAVGNYDKSALSAIYTTEELAEMGLLNADSVNRQADATRELEEMESLCERAAQALVDEMADAASTSESLSAAIEQTSTAIESLSDGGSNTADQLEQLETASKAAADALQALHDAQDAAEKALADYDETIISGTTDLAELEAAAERAGHAGEALAEANIKASNAAEDLAKATQDVTDNADKAGESGDKAGKSGTEAIEQIAQALAAAGITATVKEIAEGVYELADAFSEAEKIVVNATGATGDALDGLEESMMQAYTGHHQDLSDTAGAIGEINTRMGLTGDALTDVTGKFLDFASITGSNVVTSVQNATKIMNKWGVEQENVESVLDKLAYAGQISGASVDSLSQTLITGSAAFQEMGLSLDNTISLLAAFELYGMNSTTAITAMRTAVKNFSDDGIEASEGLRTTITQIQNMENAAEATALAVDVFGARAGVEMANAIRNGAISIEMLNGDLEAAQGTLRTTAEASETLSEKWEKSNNKIKAAFTSAVEPTLNKFSSGMANLVGRFGDFLGEHPALTKALTALGVGLGVVTVGIAGVAFATSSAIPAIVTFATTINAALGPVGWIVLGVTAAAAAITSFVVLMNDADDAIAEYDGTMEECAAELERTQRAYEKACDLYGENSSAAQELSDNLNTLNKQFEMGGGELAVYAEKAEKLAESFRQVSEAQAKAMNEIDKSETSGMTAVAMLSALSEQSTHTTADLDLMSQYADYLNDDFNCDIHVNYSTGELTGFNPELVTGAIIEAANDQRYQNALKYLSGADFQDNYIEAKRGVVDLQARLQALYQELEAKQNITTFSDPNEVAQMRGTDQIEADIASAEASLQEYEAVYYKAANEIYSYGRIIDDTGQFAKTLIGTLDEMATATDDATASTQRHTEALSAAEEGAQAAQETWKLYQEQIMALCEAYDEAYQAAYESFQGQFSLFDEASTKSEEYMNATVENAQKALDSQLAYWTAYGENIEVLKNTSAADLGITQQNYDALMAYVQDGSEQAAGLAESMVAAIESGNTDAVSKLATTLGEVNTKQSEISSAVADWQTGFSAQMDEILNKMNSTVEGLNLSTEANAAATSTMSAYANAIKTAGDSAVTAAQSIANRVKAALQSASTNINIGVSGGSVPGHATGTTNAEDVFIAGENGPELIVGKAGSTVFPAEETNRIIRAMQTLDGSAVIPGDSYQTANYDNRAYRSYSEQTSSEIINNYTTYDSGKGYDDEKLLRLLNGFVSVLASIEGKLQPQKAPEPQPIVVDAYATGTTDSDDAFIAGEKGPELIIGQPDKTVFPTEETEKIVTVLTGDDHSVADGLAQLSKAIQPAGDTISSYQQNIEYGDTAFTHTYSTVYGDTASYITDLLTEYGDSYSTVEGDIANVFEKDYTSIANKDETTSSQAFSDDHSSVIGDTATTYEGDSKRLSQSISEGDMAIAETDISNRYGTAYDTAYRYGDVFKTAYDTAEYGAAIRSIVNSSLTGDTAQTEQAFTDDHSKTIGETVTQYSAAESTNSLANAVNTLSQTLSDDHSSVIGDTATTYEGDIASASQSFSESVSAITTALSRSETGGNAFSDTAYYEYGDQEIGGSTETESTTYIYGDSFEYGGDLLQPTSMPVASNYYEYGGDTTSSVQNSTGAAETAYTSFINSITDGMNAQYSAVYGGTDIASAYEYGGQTLNTDASAANSQQAYYITDRTESSSLNTAERYGDTFQSYAETNSAVTDGSQAFQNNTTAVFMPPPQLLTAMFETALREPQDALSIIQMIQDAAAISLEQPETVTSAEIIEPDRNPPRILGGDEHDGDRSETGSTADSNTDKSERRIIIEIAGNGRIDVTDGVNRDQVLELMQDNLKPVLMDIIQGEIFEEGERNYDF
jgi:TP901 family phage tail tape measure protein